MKSLPSIGRLISDSFNLYKSSWKLFVWLVLLPILATIAVVALIGVIIATILAVSGGQVTPARIPLLIPPGLVAIVALAIINAMGKIALVKAIDLKGQTKARDMIKFAWPLVGKYIILQLMVGIVVLVGFVLLVVPGVLFMIWYLFSSIILVVEGLKGREAMKQSKAYIKGKFWGVLGRLVFMIAAIGLLSGIVSAIDNQAVIIVFQLVSTLIIAPIATMYLYHLYQGAKVSYAA